MGNRENVFTQFARDVNLFCDHKLTKENLFERFVGYIEMADENERNERKKFEEEMENFRKLNIVEMTKVKPPYSNYDEAKKMLQ